MTTSIDRARLKLMSRQDFSLLRVQYRRQLIPQLTYTSRKPREIARQSAYWGKVFGMGSITSILPPQSPLTYLLVVLIPSLPSLYARFQQWRSPQHKHPSPPAPPRPLHLYLVLAIHTLYRIKQLIQPPFNVFHQYRLPLSTSPSILSAVFVRHASIYNSTISRPTDLSDQAQRLLARMGNVDYRIMYARYGHRVMEDCGWCSTHDDFAIASTPGIVGSYVGMAVFLGMLGWDVTAGEGATARADKMRASAAWVLVGAAVAEIGARYLWDLRMVEGDCLQVCAPILLLMIVGRSSRNWETHGGCTDNTAGRHVQLLPYRPPPAPSTHIRLPPPLTIPIF